MRTIISGPSIHTIKMKSVLLGRRISAPAVAAQHHNVLSSISRRMMGTWPRMFPRRIRAISMDVTGTLVSFRGSLDEHYLGSAEKAGVYIPDNTKFGPAFKQAYKETCASFPCFGGVELTAKEWWKLVVHRSFELARITMTDAQSEKVFSRIYSIFGSLAAYEKFDDASPFLRWAKRNHIVCGVLSNADERYGDSILPMLGITHDELEFMCFSKDLELEKPAPQVFAATLQRVSALIPADDPLLPSHVLHIGNDYTKDFEGARRTGMHALLLNRYNEKELAAEWKRRGALVFEDLLDVVDFLGRSNCKLG